MATLNALLAVAAAAALALAVYVAMLYNRLVAVRNNVARAWANIDVLLKQRNDEIPKLVEVCKGYMAHERATLARLTEARARVADAREAHNVRALGPAEAALRAGMVRLYATAEAYPELRANPSFVQLQGRISGLENAIADRREYYNDSVNVNNTRIEEFPELIVARAFGFRHERMLRFEARETAGVEVGALLDSA